jgi:hypothetical protein
MVLAPTPCNKHSQLCRAHSGDHNAPWYTVRVILFEELHACNVLNFFRARSRAWCPKLGELCRGVAPAEHRLLVPVGSEGGNSEGGSGEGDGGKGVGGEGGGCEDGGGEGGGNEESGGEGGGGEGAAGASVNERRTRVCSWPSVADLSSRNYASASLARSTASLALLRAASASAGAATDQHHPSRQRLQPSK